MEQINQAIPRIEKALEIIDGITVLSDSHATYTDSDKKIYHINYKDEICECPDHVYRQVKCKHIWATQLKLKKIDIYQSQ